MGSRSFPWNHVPAHFPLMYGGTQDPGKKLINEAKALWSMGQDPALNSGAGIAKAPTNLFVDSEDMTGAAWSIQNLGTIDDATHFTFGGNQSTIRQYYFSTEGETYTLYFRGRRVTGNANLAAYHDRSATGQRTDFTFTDELADYVFTVLGRVGDGNITFGIRDNNASGFGQIEVTRWAVYPGTRTAQEAAAQYEKVGADRQTLHDWGSGSHPLTVGSSSGPDTNDPAHLIDTSLEVFQGAHADFDGVDDVCIAPFPDTLDNLSVIVLCRYMVDLRHGQMVARGDNQDWQFYHENRLPRFRGAGGPGVNGTVRPPIGQWAIHGVSCDASGNAQHYLNGAANGSGVVNPPASNIAEVQVGRQGLTGYPWEGQIVLAGIWSRVLTPEEIALVTDRVATDFRAQRQIDVPGIGT